MKYSEEGEVGNEIQCFEEYGARSGGMVVAADDAGRGIRL
jgi:hypothetical protein